MSTLLRRIKKRYGSNGTTSRSSCTAPAVRVRCTRTKSLEGVGTKTLRSTLKTTIWTTKPCSFCERSVDRCVPHDRSATGVWRPAKKQNERSEAARQGTKFENETKGGNPTAFRCDPLHYWTNDLPTGWPPEISTARFQDRRVDFHWDTSHCIRSKA